MKPRIIQRQAVAQSRLFCIEQVDLEFGNGVKASFEQLKGTGRGGVLVIPMLDEHTLLLVEEYALGVDHYELGFVKGLVDGDEKFEEAAVRELEEEVGFTASHVEVLGDYNLMPAYSNFRNHILVAKNLSVRKREGDEPEPLKLVEWPIARLRALFQHQRFTDARSHLALYLLIDHLRL